MHSWRLTIAKRHFGGWARSDAGLRGLPAPPPPLLAPPPRWPVWLHPQVGVGSRVERVRPVRGPRGGPPRRRGVPGGAHEPAHSPRPAARCGGHPAPSPSARPARERQRLGGRTGRSRAARKAMYGSPGRAGAVLKRRRPSRLQTWLCGCSFFFFFLLLADCAWPLPDCSPW